MLFNFFFSCNPQLRLCQLGCFCAIKRNCIVLYIYCSSVPCLYVDNYRCQNDKCIPRNMTCDGHDDCSDKSDELDCCTSAAVVLHSNILSAKESRLKGMVTHVKSVYYRP